MTSVNNLVVLHRNWASTVDFYDMTIKTVTYDSSRYLHIYGCSDIDGSIFTKWKPP